MPVRDAGRISAARQAVSNVSNCCDRFTVCGVNIEYVSLLARGRDSRGMKIFESRFKASREQVNTARDCQIIITIDDSLLKIVHDTWRFIHRV